MPEKYIIPEKGVYRQCETVVRCAAGTSEPFAVEVRLHKRSAFSIRNIRKTPWQMMFPDDVVLCAREKDVLELELEQWREALEKIGMKVPREDSVPVSEWNAIRKC